MKLLTPTLLALLSLSSLGAPAQIRLPALLTDHAVLQRDGPIHLWGFARPGTRISARFHNQTATAQVDPLGKWSLFLKPEAAGGPYTLTLSGDGPEKTLTDLLVGDLWLASGQSNMEMPLAGFPPSAFIQDADREIAAAGNPRLRLMLVDHKSSDVPLSDVGGAWTTCTPETATHFSAAAYFFGREIASRENIPIGLIDSTWGGTPADSWVSLDTLGANANLLPAFASRAAFANQQQDLEALLVDEKRQDDAARAARKPAPNHPWHPEQASWIPAGLYNGMIAPLTPMSIKGILWYQGETNSSPDRASSYNTLFAALIDDWREHFAQGNLPFLFVQISSFHALDQDWGLVREQQRRTLAVANTAMIVTSDIGLAENVHPPDKQTVGARLALAARALAYGETIPFSGPAYRQATPELQPDGSTALRVWFDHAEGLTSPAKSIRSFELAGADHRFQPAQARIEGPSVLVQTAAVPQPRYVRFAWSNVVSDPLYNAAGLPSSTFSSEPTPVH